MRYKVWEGEDFEVMTLRLIEDDGSVDLCRVDQFGTSLEILLSIVNREIVVYKDEENDCGSLRVNADGYPVVCRS